MTDEPSVLDFVKSLLTPWRGRPIPIPPAERSIEAQPSPAERPAPSEDLQAMDGGLTSTQSTIDAPPVEARTIPLEAPQTTPGEAIHELAEATPVPATKPLSAALPWRGLVALGLALVAQLVLEPRTNRDWLFGALLYALAVAWLIYSARKGEWQAAALPEAESRTPELFKLRTVAFLVSLPLIMLAFLAFGDNHFTSLNLALWILAFICLIWSLWQDFPSLDEIWGRFRASLWLPRSMTISGWTLLVLGCILLVVFLRVYRMNEVPPEMVSDQAEKLLDVNDVLNGQWSIFFPRNTGREPFQFYLTAAISQLFGTGISFTSLKIGTILLGLVTLPYIYLLGKEVGNPRVGLFAAAFAGISYWGNVVARIGLRFAIYPVFVAPTLYYLVRGLRTRKTNDFILAGLFLGLGLHGYSPFRIVPLVVLLAFGLYVIHNQAKGARRQAVIWLTVLVVVALVVFLPLLRYAYENPQMFSYRAITRLGSVEQPLPGPAGIIFLKNLWRAMVMFAWDNGEVWVVSVPHRPALDVISAALFYLGMVLLLLRYIRQRNWSDIFILLSIPMLMLPSILSLAFPNENPILNRTAGALIPVFIVVGIALDGLATAIEARWPAAAGKIVAWGLALALLALSAGQNYNLVFKEYQKSYEQSSWNTSEMGQAIRNFGRLFGTTDTAWVLTVPYWVDTRLVGINAGEPKRDFAIWSDQLEETLPDPRPKLFIVKLDDQPGVQKLQQIYPNGVLSVYESRIDKDFLIFLVPPAGAITQPAEAVPGEAPAKTIPEAQPYPSP